MSPDADLDQVRELEAQLGVTVAVAVAPKRFWARPTSLLIALATTAADVTHVQCADGDRLLHWIETRSREWLDTLAAIQRVDCLIIGRTDRAFQTHPQAMQHTERIINAVATHLLGTLVDLGGGSRGLIRRAAEAVLTHIVPEHFGDAEWPIVLQRLGFRVEYRVVDGLDWETPDHCQEQVADPEAQRRTIEQRACAPQRSLSKRRSLPRVSRPLCPDPGPCSAPRPSPARTTHPADPRESSPTAAESSSSQQTGQCPQARHFAAIHRGPGGSPLASTRRISAIVRTTPRSSSSVKVTRSCAPSASTTAP